MAAGRIERLGRGELESETYRELAEALFGARHGPRRLRHSRWLYEENPAVPPGDRLPLFVYWRDRRPLGQLGLLPLDLRFAGAPLDAAWCVDFSIRPECQRQGIGVALLEAAHAAYPLLLAVAPTAASLGLFRKRGWRGDTFLPSDKRLLAPLRSLPRMALRRVGASRLARRLPPPLPRRPRLPPGVTVEPVDDLKDADLGGYEEAVRRDPGAFLVRSRSWLSWRYRGNPFCSYRIERVAVEGRPPVQAVWRFVNDPLFRRARLVDFIASPVLDRAALALALGAVTEAVAAAGAEILECATSDRNVLAALPAAALRSRETGSQFLYGTAGMTGCPEIPPAAWRLYPGDSDLDAVDCWRDGGNGRPGQ